MKITIENTDQIVQVNGLPARIWEGKTDSGIEITCFIARIGVDAANNCSQFEKELRETKSPRGFLANAVAGRDLVFEADIE